MRDTILLITLRVATLVALAASAALLVDYWSSDVPYCVTEGCLGLRRWGYLAGGLIPVPLVGVAAFATVFAVSLWPVVRGVARLTQSLSVTGAIIALFLIAVMLGTGNICVPCLVTDTAAIVAGAAGGLWMATDLGRRRKIVSAQAAPQAARDPLSLPAWIVLGFLTLVAPLLWPAVRSRPAVPEAIRAMYVPDKINVIEFSDFGCGHCRDLHPRLGLLLEEFGDRVAYRRMNAPLQDRGAARAAICAEEQGEGETMTTELFQASGVTPSDIERIALAVGLDMDAFHTCVADPQTDARIDHELALLKLSGIAMTPTVYINGQRIRGAEKNEVFRDALERAARGGDRRGVNGWVYGSLVFVLLVVVGATGRRRRPRV